MSNMRRLRLILGLMAIVLSMVGCSGTQTETTNSLLQKLDWLRSTHQYGHTCIRIQTDDQAIYLDPVDLAGMDSLPPADIILISHHHPDHFSPSTIAALSKESTTIVCSDAPEIVQEIGGPNTISLAPGQKADVGGFEIEGIPASGSSYHTPDLRGLGFAFSINGVRIYCSGDTGLNPEVRSLSDIGIAVLNVRKPYALSGEDVVEFATVVKPEVIIPIHWMPENDAYGDEEEIEYIRQNLPDTTRLSILELK